MRTTALAASLFVLFNHAALADTNAPVNAVTLYPGGATVQRTAQVAQGAHELVVRGLPARFDPSTLRAEAGAGIHIGEIEVRASAGAEAINPAEAALQARIQALQDQQAMIDADAGSAQIVKGFLERYNSGAGAPAKPGPADAQALAGVIDTLGRSGADALAKIARATIKKRELGATIAALQRDLARARTGATDTRTVTIHLEASRPGSLTLSYQVDNAGWKPAYRAGLDTTASTVDLERLATVSQKTGEDWSNVKLTVSTSQPRRSPTGVEPQPWMLSLAPPQQEPLAFGRAFALAAPVASVANRAFEPADDYAAPTFVVESTYATEFTVPTRVNLGSDGREVTVLLAKQQLAASTYLRVTPRLEQSAVVIAEAARPDGVWPAGTIQLFRDGSYIGATAWGLNDATRAVFSFGHDELLNVAVNQAGLKSGTRGIFGKHQARELADEFAITNGHTTAVDVLVLEAGPVSTSDQISVRATYEPKPTVENWEQLRGVVAWRSRLAPKESRRIAVAYTIDYPQEGQVIGLR